jgi:opacity protein-like surface antigen
MKKVLLAASCAAALFGAASAASAAQVITLTAPAADGSLSGAFSDTALSAGSFTDTFTFTVPTGVLGSTLDPLTNVDFSSVTLNGQKFNVSSTGAVEFQSLANFAVTGGTQTLVVSGTSGGNGSFAGTLAFAAGAAAAVPEPASWALMLLGFGGLGAVLRQRRRTLSFA